jgi:molybdate transport system ATP-binding protein
MNRGNAGVETSSAKTLSTSPRVTARIRRTMKREQGESWPELRAQSRGYDTSRSVAPEPPTERQSGSRFLLDVDFAVSAGITILFGASGAGKTTLLDCLAGLITPDLGRIAIDAAVLFDSEQGANVPAWQRRIGYVFQDLALFPHLTTQNNIEYGLRSKARDEKHARSASIMKRFRIEHLRQRRPAAISGGERQRVALARALVIDPHLLLLDEPLAALDAAAKSHILEDLRMWNEGHRIPILYVTHSREEVFALGERVLVLENGRIVSQGTPHEVMSAPRQESIAQLVGFENIFDAVVTSLHESRGTMTCRLQANSVELETPLLKAAVGSSLRIGIRAGDILLATERPQGLSARNIVVGKITSLARRDVIVVAMVECGVNMEVHLTLAARDALQLSAGREVWLVVKTHSCHLLRK